MHVIIGTLLDVTARQREYEGRTWTEHTAHLLDGHEVTDVTLQGPSRDGRSQGLLPDVVTPFKGQRVAFEVYARGGGNKRVYVTATALLSEDSLADSLSGLVSV